MKCLWSENNFSSPVPEEMLVVHYTRSVTGCQTGDHSWLIATTCHVCQFATSQRLSFFLHTYMNVCGIITLERGILWHFFLACLFVLFVCCCDPSWTVTPFDDLLPIRCIGHSWKKCVEKSNANARHLTWIVYWGCIIPSYNIINILANFNYTVSNN